MNTSGTSSVSTDGLANSSELEAERDFLLTALRDMETEHADGRLTDDEYTALRDQQTHRAAEVLRALEANARAVRDPAEAGGGRLRTSRPPVDVRPKRMLWIAGIVAFVLLAAGLAWTAMGDRLSGDSATGTISGDTNTLLAKASQLTSDGKAADAVKVYDQVLARDPNNLQALAYRGWLVRLAGLPAQGLTSIDRAIQLDPTYPDAHFFRGFILLRDRNDPNGAIPEFQAFLANNPPQDLVPLVQQALQSAQAEAATAGSH